jgi:AraC-like DNA-binding protein
VTQVSIIALRALVAGVESIGVDRARLLAAAGLAATLLDDADARLSLAEYGRVVRAALATSGDPALGLHMGEQANTGSFDVLGHLAEHSSCLREALELSAQYSRIVAEGPRLELREAGDAVTVRLPLLAGESPELRMAAEYATSALLQLARRYAGRDAQPRRVFFAYGPPAHRAEYTRVFGGREQFSHAFTGIELERSWLDRAQLTHSPELSVLLKGRAELLLARIDRDAPATERVKRWLVSQDLQTKPTMETIARELGMSARSLRRRLREERATYDALVEAARVIHAKRMLADPRRSVQETAYAMGFATPGAFSRAFKRWTGMSPSTYRAAR